MSRVVQIDVAQFEGGGRKLFSRWSLDKELTLRDDRGGKLEVTTLEDCYTSSANREGGPVRIFAAYLHDRDGRGTIFRDAVLKVYKGYEYQAILQVD
jgi:hypothetical protein